MYLDQRKNPKMSSPRHPQVTRPKRPLSAYNLFFIDDRKRLLRALTPDDSALGADRETQQIEEVDSKHFEVRIRNKSDRQTETPEPDRKRKVGRPRGPNYKPRKKHGAFGFSQLASMVACDWKNLERSLKKPYEDQATVQLKRYREAMLEYKKTVEKVKKETNGKDQNESIDPANNDGDKQRSQPSKVYFSTPLPPAKSLTSPSPQVTRPKRPLSAYNLFFMDNRKRLLRALTPDDSALGADRESQQIEEVDSKHFEVRIKESDEQTETPEPDRKRKVGRPRGPNYKPRKKHGAFGFSQLASMVACDWKNLERSLKKPYEDQATVQLKRYREAMLEYKKTVEKVKKETNGKDQNESIGPANYDGDKQRSQPSKVSFSTPLPPAKSLTSPSQQHLYNVPAVSFLVEHDPFSDSSCSEEPDPIRASPRRLFTPPCIYDPVSDSSS